MKRKVFYSWQSDLPSSTNRGFIYDALRDACVGIAADDTVDVEPVIDRDTEGVAGAPDIASTIFAKISEADVFVADVSIVCRPADGRPTPNPNVLLELGYALKALGHDRVILVFNEAFGQFQELPFDLRTKRITKYSLEALATDKAIRKKELQKVFDVAIRASLRHVVSIDLKNDDEDLIKAIYEDKKIKKVLLRKNLSSIFEKIQSIQPKSFSEGGTYDDFFQALEKSLPILKDLVKITNAIAICSDAELVREFIDGYGWILEKYNVPKGCTTVCDKRDFEFYRFLGHEIWVIFIASLLKERCFDLLSEVFNSQIPISYLSGVVGPTAVSWNFANQSLEWLLREGEKKKRVNLASDLFHQRHVTDDVINFDDFLAGDLLLYLRNEFDRDLKSAPNFRWLPWSCLYLDSMPLFIQRAERVSEAEKIMKLLNYSGSINDFKDAMLVLVHDLNKPFQFQVRIREDAIDRIGLK